MELLLQAYDYILTHPARFFGALTTHLWLSTSALLVAGVIAIPLGILSARQASVSGTVMAAAGTLRVIPSLAILALALPFLGTGFAPALIALTVLAGPPILINTFLGFRQVPAELLEAARGMGMDFWDVLLRVEFPVALPAILTGLRTAAVEVVAGATLAAFIGGGGLGAFIISGLSLYDFRLLLVGAIPVALLAVLIEVVAALLVRTSLREQPC